MYVMILVGTGSCFLQVKKLHYIFIVKKRKGKHVYMDIVEYSTVGDKKNR